MYSTCKASTKEPERGRLAKLALRRAVKTIRIQTKLNLTKLKPGLGIFYATKL